MKVLVDGTVPTGSGLSSSAAMVVSSLIASLISSPHSSNLPKHKIVELAMVSERNVGVNSGGMDQAASVFGEKEKAVLVEFAPELRGTTVAFPSIPGREIAFVIANSLVNADKHETAPENYNLRVVETTCAAEILAAELNLGELRSRDGFGGTLQEVVQRYYQGQEIPLAERLDRFQKVVDVVFKDGGEYTLQELAKLMRLTESELVLKYMTKFEGTSHVVLHKLT
jgi:galactokinase